MEKYEKDVEAKQHELDVLKASKAKDLDKLQELTKLVSTCLLPPKIRKFNTIEKYSVAIPLPLFLWYYPFLC